MIEDESRWFDAWLTASRFPPTLAYIFRWAESGRDDATQTALRRLPTLSIHDRAVIEALSKRLTGKLLSPHANFAKEIGGEDDQSERLLLLASIFKEGTP
jgi:glutamyl-tRNA reductase